MKTGTAAKLKFKKLKRRLRLPHWQVTGLLEALWLSTYADAPDGDIGRLTNEEIAANIEYDGDPDELIEALVDAGWLDRVDPDPWGFRLIIHDWSKECANFHKGNYRKHGKQFADEIAFGVAREAPREIPSEAPRDATSDVATKPNQTQPDLTQPNQETLPLFEEAAGEARPAAPGKPRTAAEVPLPPALDTAEFLSARDEWFAQRRAKRVSMRPDHIERTYAALAPLGASRAAACLLHTVQNDYAGIFPEKFKDGKHMQHGRGEPGAGQVYPD